MKTKLFTTIIFTMLVFFASPLPPPGNSWAPSFANNLGLLFSNPPGAGSDFSQVTGSVDNPEVLAAFGLRGIAKGSQAVVNSFYQVDFKVTEGGKTFMPSIIKITVGNQYVVISPQRGTKALKALAKGDKNAKPAGNGWIPSFSSFTGIDFSNPPANGTLYSTVIGTVEQPGVLKGFGFPNVSAGQKVQFKYEEPLELKGTSRAVVRISTSNFYEVFVVENGSKLVPITTYW
ncbi:MAG: hypothetical protein HN778_16165 [Prolixibacteraceae bacterium]|mgnify:CR=1 FL=1|jgi:hypothetical protein|nr:hypothetical protein [Prolixibacteraceae bacterium]MBT6999270.1 hypothetical protein [Prolixibacteraceae bacterium]MBT7396363.1 hypothetical protein [Prolixibacteraceae bacterium]